MIFRNNKVNSESTFQTLLLYIKKEDNFRYPLSWAMRDSNPRPSGCKPDALNQLS